MNPYIVAAIGAALLAAFHTLYNKPLRFDAETQQRFEGSVYYMNLWGNIFDVPHYVLYRIGLIESGYRNQALGGAGEIGMFQISPIALTHFNDDHNTIWTAELLYDVNFSAQVAAWLLSIHLAHYDGDIEKSVKAYNTGRGGIHSSAAERYWNKFVDAGQYFPEGGFN